MVLFVSHRKYIVNASPESTVELFFFKKLDLCVLKQGSTLNVDCESFDTHALDKVTFD